MNRTSRRDMRELLELAGSREVPPRAETTRLFTPTVMPVPLRGEGATDELAERRASRRLPAVLTGAAAAILVVVLVAAVALSSSDGDGVGDRSELALITAVDTVVMLPDGSTIAGARGVELPDGTVIRTGPQGRATVAGVRLGPDTEAVVRAGRVQVLDAAEPTSDLPADAGSGTATPESGAPAGDPGGGSPSGGGADVPSTSPPPVELPPVVVPPLPLPSLPTLDDVLPLR
jgi:hypothetical protein